MPQVGAGGPGPFEWQTLIQALHALWQAADALSPLLNVFALGDILMHVAQRVHPAEEAVAAHADNWRSRGGDPWDLFALLSARSWTSGAVAELLGCSESEAEALLWGWGFIFDEMAGTWDWDDDKDAEIIRSGVAAALRAGETGQRVSVTEAVAEVVEAVGRGDPLWLKPTVVVEEYGFMVFPEVWEGPKWATLRRDDGWRRHLGLDEDPDSPLSQPRGRTVELRLDNSWRLDDVLNTAASEFEICLSQFTRDMHPQADVADKIDGVAFYLPGDESIWIPKQRFTRRLPVIDRNGLLSVVDFRQASVGGLRRAGEMGLIVGDPLHPYLRPWVSAGAVGGPGEWANVMFALKALWKFLDDLGPATNLVTFGALAGALVKRLRSNVKTVEKVAPTLEQRGIRPAELKLLLTRRTWALAEVSGLLGMSVEDAAAVLASLGFEASENGMWEVSISPDGGLVGVSVDIATYATTGDEEQVRGRIKYAISVTMNTGQAPNLQAVYEDPALDRQEVDDDESD